MARRRKTPESASEAVGEEGWVAATARRLEVSREAYPARRQPSYSAFVEAVDTERGGTGAASSSSSGVTTSDAVAAARRMHRHGGEGLLATGFEPQRHSIMILGRPVQVPVPERVLLLGQSPSPPAEAVALTDARACLPTAGRSNVAEPFAATAIH